MPKARVNDIILNKNGVFTQQGCSLREIILTELQVEVHHMMTVSESSLGRWSDSL